ncbi:MAG: RluA family pseudouridine synthase [Burkholderiaceae bacterium]|nr:RluA family pseudouridine synthase [Burkholderiaceae bacterium]
MVQPEGTDASLDEAEFSEDGPADVHEQRQGVVAREWHAQRLDKLLVTMAPEFSRSHLQGLIERGHVQVDGVAVTTASRKVLSGQRVLLELVPTEESRAFKAEQMDLHIVFEDAHLMVVNKPAGLVVHPAAGNWSGTLMNGVLAHHAAAATLARAGIVHRLDKDTSGLMVVGKTLEAVTALTRMIAARDVHREYLAMTHGLVPKTLTVDEPIRRDPQSRIRMAALAGGKPARTDIYLVAARDGMSAVRCVLHSGRTHQIRVHLSCKGFPLLADALYGGKPALGLTRQALHATRLSFAHPIGAKPLAFEAALPGDLAPAWAQLTESP